MSSQHTETMHEVNESPLMSQFLHELCLYGFICSDQTHAQLVLYMMYLDLQLFILFEPLQSRFSHSGVSSHTLISSEF